MTKLSNLIAATFVAGLLATPVALAQDDHKGHHPEEATKQAPATKAEPAPQQKGMGMGTMGGDHMKQMQDMCGQMMGKGMGNMGTPGNMGTMGDNGPSSQAYASANARMHQSMTLRSPATLMWTSPKA